MGQIFMIIRIATLGGLLLVAAEEYRGRDLPHAALALAVAALAMR